MKFKKAFAVVILLVVALSFTACGFRTDINSFADELFTALFTDDALSVNFFFDNPSEYGLDDESASLPLPASKEDYETSMSAMLLQAKLMSYRINYKKLEGDDKQLFETLQDLFINRAEFADYYYLQDGYLGSYMGQQANLPIYLTEYKFRRVEDINNYLTLVNDTATAFPAYLEFEQARIDNGYGRASYVLEGALNQTKAMTGVDITADKLNYSDYTIPTTQHFLTKNFIEKINACDFLSEQEKNDKIQLGTAAIQNTLLPAYLKLGIGLQKILNDSPADKLNEQGLAHFENGQDYYRVLFKDATGSSDSVESAYLKLYNAYTQTRLDMSNLLNSVKSAYNKTNADIEADLNTLMSSQQWDNTNLYAVLDKLKTDIGDLFPAFADTADIVLKQVDESLQDYYSPAAYFVSPIDNLQADETIIINSYGEIGYANYDLLAHEGIPGHLYQHAYLRASSLHNAVKVLAPSSYKEGWATYVQYYIADQYSADSYQNALFKLYQYQNLLGGYLRSIVDIWVNFDGISREQMDEKITSLGIDAETNKAYLDRTYKLVVEVPTNAATYFYSYLKFLEAKDFLVGQKGYTELEFHTAMLDSPYSFDIIFSKYGIK